MINILLVEDSELKTEEILNKIKSSETLIDISPNYISAKSNLENKKYDLMILDLHLPMRDGENAQESSGIKLLREVCKSSRLHIPTSIIGLTSNDECYKKYKNEFDEKLFFLLNYQNFSWITNIQDKIEQISLASQKMPFLHTEMFDVFYVCALSIELKQVLDLPLSWSKLNVNGDPSQYYETSFNHLGKKLKIGAVSSTEMGMSAASALTAKIIKNFNPGIIVMTGICAGVEGKSNLGDILILDPVFDYNSGKIIEDKEGNKKFEGDTKQCRVDEKIKAKINDLLVTDDSLNEIYTNCSFNKPKNQPKVIIGPVGTGASVVTNKKVINDIVELGNRKLIGVEMEAYGVYAAAHKTSDKIIPVVAIKSVCDLANSEKNDDYQDCASFFSAQFSFIFLKNYFS